MIYKVSLLFCCVLFFSCSSQHEVTKTKRTPTNLKSIDGPYIFDLNDSIKVINVSHKQDSLFEIVEHKKRKQKSESFTSIVSNIDNDSFTFSLFDKYVIPASTYKQPSKVFVTSDIEGNFNAFYSLLIGAKIMDKEYNWIFGDGHFVIAGDMMDRGNNVIPCLWLLYKLEQEAKKQGGKVHFILGNHDVMNLQLDIRYVLSKYKKLAKIISGKEDEKEAYQYLMSKNNELIKWISSKNTIEKIGNNLILHGGISPDIVDANLGLDIINKKMRKYIFQHLMRNPSDDEIANLIFSRMGPIWYRGLVVDYREYYKKVSENDLDMILKFYDVEHIIVGHTIVDDHVTTDFDGKVIRVDMIHSTDKFSGKSQGLLIENGKYYSLTDLGVKKELLMD